VSHPSWYATAILALASWRLWRLIALDTILDPVRDRLLSPRSLERRFVIQQFVLCPWCLGFWAVAILWLCWLWTPSWTIGLCVPLAVSAVVGALGDRL